MARDWRDLTERVGDEDFVVTRVRLPRTGIEVGGEFEPPLLARLEHEDQVFVGEFVRCHGSIKHMEKAFGVSYPTIKNRLNRIADRLRLVQIDTDPRPDRSAILERLDRGEITASQAAEQLREARS